MHAYKSIAWVFDLGGDLTTPEDTMCLGTSAKNSIENSLSPQLTRATTLPGTSRETGKAFISKYLVNLARDTNSYWTYPNFSGSRVRLFKNINNETGRVIPWKYSTARAASKNEKA